jgi:hypothetical protein
MHTSSASGSSCSCSGEGDVSSFDPELGSSSGSPSPVRGRPAVSSPLPAAIPWSKAVAAGAGVADTAPCRSSSVFTLRRRRLYAWRRYLALLTESCTSPIFAHSGEGEQVLRSGKSTLTAELGPGATKSPSDSSEGSHRLKLQGRLLARPVSRCDRALCRVLGLESTGAGVFSVRKFSKRTILATSGSMATRADVSGMTRQQQEESGRRRCLRQYESYSTKCTRDTLKKASRHMTLQRCRQLPQGLDAISNASRCLLNVLMVHLFIRTVLARS